MTIGTLTPYSFPVEEGTAGQILKYNAVSTELEWATDLTTTTWGSITGTLSNQTDLQTALDAKQDNAPVSEPALPGSTGAQGTWATGSGYLYFCIATDTWVRFAVVSSWT